jgi:gliding motility-associated-like protein
MLNDTWDLSGFNVLRLQIFNRNGRSVYTKQNYTNEWVGQSSDGELPVGTYFYVAELENN